MKRSDLQSLLNRGAAALETPADLNAEEIGHVSEDLAAAAKQLEDMAILVKGQTFDEKGNVHLSTEEGDHHAVMCRLVGDMWLLLHLNPDNEPACRFQVVKHTNAEMADFIEAEYDGWIVNRLNVDGVIHNNGRVGADTDILKQQRRDAAERWYLQSDLNGDQVKDARGWEDTNDPNEIKRTLFVEQDNGKGASVVKTLTVKFYPNRTKIIAAHLPGTNMTIMGGPVKP